MKHLLLSCISLMFCLTSWGGTPIKLENKNKIEERHYSVPITPTITHDHSVIHIYSGKSLSNLIILISDEQGNIIYTETTNVSAGIPYTLILPEMESGIYTIELINDEDHFSGSLFH